MIKNIVFDLGGVLIDWDPRHLYRKVFKNEAKMEKFLATVCTQEWNEKQDEGRSFKDGIDELLKLHPEHKAEIEIWDSRWHEMISGAIQPTVEILADIKKLNRHRLLGLSNWSNDKFHVAEDRFEFLKWFEHIVVSGRIQLKKPDPRIFQHLCEACRITPQESLFIDDSRANIASALKLGFHALHFTSAARLRGSLYQLGVLL